MVLKILLSAYCCEPGRGSEPGVGWNWVRHASRFHEVWVITRTNLRSQVEQAAAASGLQHVTFVYFDLPPWARFWKRGQRGVRSYYYLWQLGAFLVARRLHREVGFDLVHHITIGVYWMPSLLALLPVFFIWGPVGGAERTPRSFERSFGLSGWVYERGRDMARFIGERDPLVRITARHAAVALAKTEVTRQRLRQLGSSIVLVMSETLLSAEEVPVLGRASTRYAPPFRVGSVGRLLHWKGFAFGLRAFARFHAECPDSEYWMIGDGPERGRLEKLAKRLGVEKSVVFWGPTTRSEALAKLSECDLLLHPSLHDSGGWTCPEAMAAGRPVICLDLAGPATQVTPDTGIKVPALCPDQIVRDLSTALMCLARDPDLRARMGWSGQQRVGGHFILERQGDFWTELRHRALAFRANT